MDVRGKYGLVTKTVTLNTSHGPQYLVVSARVPDPVLNNPNAAGNAMSAQQRQMNLELAKNDRQLVFKGGCATCHAEPARGKMGAELFAAACGVCHDAPHRAQMVPDLRNPKRPAQREYWFQWVMFGKPGTLMPAFARKLHIKPHGLVHHLRGDGGQREVHPNRAAGAAVARGGAGSGDLARTRRHGHQRANSRAGQTLL
jgi:mono/diheme cytochrome c family protein